MRNHPLHAPGGPGKNGAVARGLRLLTWNLWGNGFPRPYVEERGTSRGAVPGSPAGTNPDRGEVIRHRRALMMGGLQSAGADVIAIQEDDAGGYGRHSEWLAARLPGYEVIATDSSLAYLVRRTLDISSAGSIELARQSYPPPLNLELMLGGLVVQVMNLHLSLVSAERQIVVAAAMKHVRDDIPVLLCGDLNDPSTEGVLTPLVAAGFVDAGASLGPTMPIESPAVRLDYIWLRASGSMNIVETGLVGGEPDAVGHYASDHLGVLVALDCLD